MWQVTLKQIRIPKNTADLIHHARVYMRWPRLSYLLSLAVYIELQGHGKNPDEEARKAGMKEVQLGPNEIIGLKNKSETSLTFFRHAWVQRRVLLRDYAVDHHRWWNAGAWLFALKGVLDAVEPMAEAVASDTYTILDPEPDQLDRVQEEIEKRMVTKKSRTVN
jgi:hypothetical protein